MDSSGSWIERIVPRCLQAIEDNDCSEPLCPGNSCTCTEVITYSHITGKENSEQAYKYPPISPQSLYKD